MAFFLRIKIIVFLFICFSPFCLPAFSLRPLFEKSYNYFQEGEYEKSIDLAKQIISANPNFFQAYNLIGFNRIREGISVLDSVYYFKKSLKIQPKQPQIYNIISTIYNELGQEEQGLFYLQEGVKNNPGNFLLNYNTGLAFLLLQHEPDEALVYFKNAEKIEPKNQELLYLLGVSYLFCNQKEMTIDLIIRLREAENEPFARKLEELVRRTERGQVIGFGEVIELYHSQSQEKEAKKETKPQVEIGTPQITIKGEGKIYIRQRFQQAQ